MTPWTVRFSFLGFRLTTHDDGGYQFALTIGRFNWSIGIDPDFASDGGDEHAG